MNGKFFSVGMGLFFSLTGMCFAATPVAQGVISFHGSIVESSCASSAQVGGLRLDDCPALARGSVISVRSVEPVRSVSALDHYNVGVKLVADSGKEGRYYNQQYALVDGSGKPVNSGAYLITLTSP
ncbi:type 1 fimbrial protein [Pseudomonas sp. CVAP|uniref:type 1 fimbrial protein n=1 Tax=Pseudomonas sp. CVAP\|nr:type 1 fimbrial protein [Pseudomonas sp. CVAP\